MTQFIGMNNQAELESVVGKYGAFWIYHIEHTNWDLYKSLSQNAILKMALEINYRIYQMIDSLVSELFPSDKAEEIALNQIIYTDNF